ncbi:MAG: phosphoenolpyruvate carboxykinase (ATP) [Candidatus Cloacimonetes bacterium]|nr:phosphoenolpyruvate carboxykinase (ATP) [Candidatus Cloacimonadota bacterium]
MSLSESTLKKRVKKLLDSHSLVYRNPSRKKLIQRVIEGKEAIVASTGTLATWTCPDSTGRSPKDTVIVRRPESEDTIDWDSPSSIPISADTFDMVLKDAFTVLTHKARMYVTDRVLGADSSYALPVRTITDRALTALFTDNMFRQIPDDISNSVFADREFLLIALPYNKLSRSKYKGRLRKLSNGKTSEMVIAIDFDRRIGIVYGSSYGGSVKKLMFTVMNYYLPEESILPLHASANEGSNGNSALLLGLSGTGKTTLSADPKRALLGDDEHGWNNHGIANFEQGCYAKLINLNREKEPEIYKAMFHDSHYLEHGAIAENTMMYPHGKFDVHDDRLTPNSRGSYPLSFLKNIKKSAMSGHPKTILFLTADANSVLHPIAKLTPEQAMLWFLMGYTSKLAGTETGVDKPVSTFSRFFGEPFMPRNPEVYASLLGEKMRKHGTDVYLINTGWSGGPIGIGKRMDITLTRQLVNAALSGLMKNCTYYEDTLFHVLVPESIPGVPGKILNARNTWDNPQAYDKKAKALAKDFSRHYNKAYGKKNIDQEIKKQCPGK